MSDDITFCANECKNKKCRRHRSNIREPQYLHSFAYFEGTQYCEKKHKPTGADMRGEENGN